MRAGTAGLRLMERALILRSSRGVKSAADLLVANGIPHALAILALVGAKNSNKYGVDARGWHSPPRK